MYLLLGGIERTDLQCIPADNYIWDYGSQPDIQHPDRKYQDKGQSIFDWCKLVLNRNLSSRDIRVDS